MAKSVEKLQAELDALGKAYARDVSKIARLREALCDNQKKCRSIRQRMKRQQIVELIGVPNAVRVATHNLNDMAQGAGLGDRAATVLAVRRTKASLDYGTAGQWTCPIGNIEVIGKPGEIPW